MQLCSTLWLNGFLVDWLAGLASAEMTSSNENSPREGRRLVSISVLHG